MLKKNIHSSLYTTTPPTSHHSTEIDVEYSVGANVHPCRRPFLTSKLSDSELPTLTSACMPSWKDFTILNNLGSTPHFSNTHHRASLGTELYAFLISNSCLAHKNFLTTPPSFKATLGFWQNMFCNYLQPLLDDPSKDLPHNIQQADAMPVVTVQKVFLLWYRHHFSILSVCYYLPFPPYVLHQL